MLSAEESIVKWLVQVLIGNHRQSYEEEWTKLATLQSHSVTAFRDQQAVLRRQLELNGKLTILSKEIKHLEAFHTNDLPQLDRLSVVCNPEVYLKNKSDALSAARTELAAIQDISSNLDLELEDKKSVYVQTKNALAAARLSIKPVESCCSPRPLHKILWPSTFNTAEDWKPWKQVLASLPKDPNDRISLKSLKDYVEKYGEECDRAIFRTIGAELAGVERSFNEMRVSLRGEERMQKKMHATYESVVTKLQHEFDDISAHLEECFQRKYGEHDGTDSGLIGEDENLDNLIVCYKQLCFQKSTQLSLAIYQRSCVMHAADVSGQKLSNLECQYGIIGGYYRSLLCKHLFDWPLPFPRQKVVHTAEESSTITTTAAAVVPPVALLEDAEKMGQEAFLSQQRILRDEYGIRLRGLVEEHKSTWDLFLQDRLLNAGDGSSLRQPSSLNSLPIITLKDSIELWVLQQATAEQIDPSDQKRWEMYQRYKLQVKRKWSRAEELQQADIAMYEFIEANKKRLEMLSDVQPVRKGENIPKKLTKETIQALMAEEQTIRMKTREMKFELRQYQETYLASVDRCQEVYEKWLKLARTRQDDWLAHLASQEGKVIVEGAESIKWRRDEIDVLWMEADGLAVRAQYEARQSRQLAKAAAELSQHWEENNRRWLVFGELESARRRYQSAITNAAAAAIEDADAMEQLAVEKAAAQEELYRLQDEYDQHGKLFYYLADNGSMNDEDLRLARLKELEDLDRTTVFKWNLVLQKQRKVHETFQPPPEDLLLGITVEEAQTDRLSQHQELKEVSYDAELRSYVNSVLRKWIYDKGDDWQSGVKSCAMELREHALSMAITDSCDLAEKAWTSIIATGLRALNKDNAVRKKSTSLKKQIAMQEVALATVRDARLLFVDHRKVLDRLDMVWSSILKEKVRRRHEKCIAAARRYLYSEDEFGKDDWETQLTAQEREEYNSWAEKHNELHKAQLADELQTLDVIDALLCLGEEKATYFRKYISYYNVDMLSVNQEITLRTLGVAREEYRRRLQPIAERKVYFKLGNLSKEERRDAISRHLQEERNAALNRIPQDMAIIWQQHVEHILGHDRIKRQPYKGAMENIVSLLKNSKDSLHNYGSSAHTCHTKWLVTAKYCSKGLMLLKHQQVKSFLQSYEFLQSETSHRLLDLVISFQLSVVAALVAQPSSSHLPPPSANGNWKTSISWLIEASFYLELASAILYRLDYNGVSEELIAHLIVCLQRIIVRSAATCTLLLGESFDERSPIKVIKKHFLGLNESYSGTVTHLLQTTSCTAKAASSALSLLHDKLSIDGLSFDVAIETDKFIRAHEKV